MCAFIALQGPSFAQDASEYSAEELRSTQRQLFDQMFSDPDNLKIMFEYALVSIKLQDYERAISTLERMLIYRQDLSRVRLELAVAYFNLGSYEVAQLYFDQVLADPELPDDVRTRIGRYTDEISRRTSRNTLSLVANVGLTYATNANLGPLDNNVIIGGTPGFILDPDSQSQPDSGIRYLIYGTHAYDLERSNVDAYETDFSAFGLVYGDVKSGNTFFGRVRTGPRLSLTDEQFGAQVRPYVEGNYLNADDRTVYFGGFGGLEYASSLSRRWATYADISAGVLDFEKDRNEEDRVSFRFLGGGAFIPSRDLVGRAAAIFEYEKANADYNSSIVIGARLSTEYLYDSGVELIDRKWSVSAYLDGRYRWYDSADPFIDPNTVRNEFDLRGGISHLFAIRDGFGLVLDVEGFLRDSNIQNFDLNNLSVTLSLQYRL